MKSGDAEYTALVEKKRSEIRGNISSVKMTEAETAKEIADIQDGAVSTFEGKYEIPQDGKSVTVSVPSEIIPPVLSSIPRKRGRPLGSRNKPKEPK